MVEPEFGGLVSHRFDYAETSFSQIFTDKKCSVGT